MELISNSYCSSEAKNRSDKKVRLETKGFCNYFWEVDHPLWDVCMEKKTQILIAHQKQRIDRTKKVPLEAKKSSASD